MDNADSPIEKMYEANANGKFQESLAHFDRLSMDTLPPETKNLALTLKARALVGLGSYTDAVDQVTEILRVKKYDLALTLHYMANILDMMNNQVEAVAKLREALTYFQESNALKEETYVKMNIAMDETKLGRVGCALRLLEDALSTVKNKDSEMEVELLMALGDIQMYIVGGKEVAKRYYYFAYNRSFDLSENLHKKALRRYSWFLSEIENNYEEATRCLLEVLDLTNAEVDKAVIYKELADIDKTNGKKHLERSLNIYRSLQAKYDEARTLQHLGDIADSPVDALSLYKDACKIFVELQLKQEKAEVYNLMSQRLIDTGKLPEAESLLLELADEQLSPSMTAWTYIGLGVTCKKRGSLEGALIWFRKAEALLENVRHDLYIDDKISFQGRYINLKKELSEILLQSNASEAFTKTEEAKSRVLTEAISLSSIWRPTIDPVILEREERLLHDLNAAISQQNPARRGILTELDNVWSSLEQYPELQEYVGLRRGKVSSVQEILDVMSSDTAFLTYLLRDKRMLILLFARGRMDRITIETDTNYLQKLSNRFKNVKPNDLDRGLLDEAGSIILGKVIDKLDGVKHLCVSPDGFLHYIPFHSLIVDDKYMIERCSLSYTPNLSILRSCIKRHATGDSFLIVGGSPKEDLNYARKEALTIARLLESRVSEFNRDEFLEQMKSSNIVSLSCHAEFSEEDTGLASSILLPNGDVIRGRDILKTKLNSDLITLNGCETARINITTGNDILGLVSSFLYAGTKSLVASLWKLNDFASYRVMEEFYNNISIGMAKAEALCKAQTILLRSAEFKDPYYWAPLILVGDWSPVVKLNRKYSS
jgi:CHAT domain-containing protein